MANENSPSSIMYDDFKSVGIKKYDAAKLLLDGQRSFGGGILADRIESRSQLTRYVIQVAPGELGRGLFKDFRQSSQALLGRMAAHLRESGNVDPYDEIARRYSGPSADAMQRALDAYGADGNVYRNALERIAHLDFERDLDRAQLYLLLFVVAGCIGDPHVAVDEVEAFSCDTMGLLFRTPEARVDEAASNVSHGTPLIGLIRIIGGKVKAGSLLYQIPADERGAEIGARASGAGAITDVDGDVSGHHARIYRRGESWYIVGLGSMNGTTVISGADKAERVVEPPRKERARGYVATPMEILPADTICLGATTRFLVMSAIGA